MSLIGDAIFLNGPESYPENYLIDANQQFTYSKEVFSDDAESIPFDLTGYTARGAFVIQNQDQSITPVVDWSCNIILPNLVIGTLTTLQVQSILQGGKTYLFDLTVDKTSDGTSIPLGQGFMTVIQAASRAS